MIKLETTLLSVALAVTTFLNSYAQSEKVILYNSQPVKVELTEKGNIKSFIGLVPGYMEGYDLSAPSIAVVPDKVEQPILPASVNNASYSVVSTEREELKYKANFATLDKVIINKLNDIASRLKADPNARILLTAHKASLESNRLTTNRLASAIAYLGLKGIVPERIQTDIQKNEILNDIIAVNYLN